MSRDPFSRISSSITDRMITIVRSRYIGYILFLVLMLAKLMFLHSGLHAPNIDMNRLDKLIALGSVMLLSFWVLWLPDVDKP